MLSCLSSSTDVLPCLKIQASALLAQVTPTKHTQDALGKLGQSVFNLAQPYIPHAGAALSGSLLAQSLMNSSKIGSIRDLAASVLLGGLAYSQGQEDLTSLAQIFGACVLAQLIISACHTSTFTPRYNIDHLYHHHTLDDSQLDTILALTSQAMERINRSSPKKKSNDELTDTKKNQ